MDKEVFFILFLIQESRLCLEFTSKTTIFNIVYPNTYRVFKIKKQTLFFFFHIFTKRLFEVFKIMFTKRCFAKRIF